MSLRLGLVVGGLLAGFVALVFTRRRGYVKADLGPVSETWIREHTAQSDTSTL